MVDRHIPGRLAGVLVTAAIVASGCGQEQVNGINLIDCAKGPKTNEMTFQLPKGQQIHLGGTDSIFGPNGDTVLITSQGGGNITVEIYAGNNHAEVENTQASGLPALSVNGVIFESNGNVEVLDGDKTFTAKVGIGDGNTTKLDITATCNGN